jgi:hypothetical protein
MCGAGVTGVDACVRLFVEEGQITGSSAGALEAMMINGPTITRAQYRRDDEPERSMSGRIIIRRQALFGLHPHVGEF